MGSRSIRSFSRLGIVKAYVIRENVFNNYTMNHVGLCCDCQLPWLRSYRRLADYPFGSQCRFVIKWEYIFTMPFRVKFIHLIPLPKCKHLDFMKIESVVTAMISEYPFNSSNVWLAVVRGGKAFIKKRVYVTTWQLFVGMRRVAVRPV